MTKQDNDAELERERDAALEVARKERENCNECLAHEFDKRIAAEAECERLRAALREVRKRIAPIEYEHLRAYERVIGLIDTALIGECAYCDGTGGCPFTRRGSNDQG